MLTKILIANRGEIAVRILRTCRRLGIAGVAVHSDPDRDALFVEMADEAVSLGGTTAAESYLRGEAIIAAALATGAEAIHPGYGFLSENPEFAQQTITAGLRFIGPSPAAIRAMGLKDAAKTLMEKAGVPVVPGYHGPSQDPDELLEEACKIGFPVLIKARAGGGGKGMRRVAAAGEFKAALGSAAREAEASFGDPVCLIEKYLSHSRHIEIQIMGDDHGQVVHLFERDCSLQRRHQKVIEEAPAPGMPGAMREAMGEAAVTAARAIGYSGAGTVEFIADASEGLQPGRFWFMEMNTRLQVEHPVTELITGVDLVEWQLRVASGEALPKRQQDLSINGWAFEARLYAEDAAQDFLPATGRLAHLSLPEQLARIDSGVRAGDRITPFYDPMIAKIITHGATRAEALARLTRALEGTRIAGTVTNCAFLARLSRQAEFVAGHPDTGLIARHAAALTLPEAIAPELAAVAALALTGRLLPEPLPKIALPGVADPWDQLTGFRLWGAGEAHVTLEHQGKAVAVTLQPQEEGGFAAWVDGQPVAFVLRPKPEGGYRLTVAGHSQTVDILLHAGSVTLYRGAVDACFTLYDLLRDEAGDHMGGDRLLAPMPGLVRRLMTVVGARVAKGEPLMLLEAMKMEMALAAPRAGLVAEICVTEGEQVQDGAVLMTLEPVVEEPVAPGSDNG